MNSMKITPKVCASSLLLCIAAVTSGVFGQKQQRLSKDTLIATAREIMATARYCALITLDSKGRAHARTMDPFPPDENLVIWFGTNPKSRKVAEIRRNQRVTLYYFDRESPAYVTISGIARLDNDPKEKARRWKGEWKAFYPDRGKGYLLIAVTPETLEVVSEKKGILGDARNVDTAGRSIRLGTPAKHSEGIPQKVNPSVNTFDSSSVFSPDNAFGRRSKSVLFAEGSAVGSRILHFAIEIAQKVHGRDVRAARTSTKSTLPSKK
jgi:general stress protein 26